VLNPRATIPAFLNFDVEPDAFQIFPGERPSWSGYGALYEFAGSLRKELTSVTGRQPQFGWYFRTDPQIAQVCGRADAAMTSYPDRIDKLHAAGDYFGVHSHLMRWSDRHDRWVHDVADGQWVRDCTALSLDAFEQWNGSPATLFRAGAGYMSNDIVDVLDERGVIAEMSLEPVAGWWMDSKVVGTEIDDSPIVGTYTDLSAAPRVPYRPARKDFRVIGAGEARNLVLVPHTTGALSPPKAGWLPKAKRVIRRMVKPRLPHSLYLRLNFPSDQYYWDLISYQLASMRRPYLSLAMRTEAADSVAVDRVCRRLTALARHPLAKQLRFVNPLEAMASLLPDTRNRSVKPRRAA
jgi:hypothetical protein